jgi:hypothetical protein
MAHSNGSAGKSLIFFTGMLAGGVIGAAAVYLISVPSGKKWLHDMQRESVALKGKSVDLYRVARKKSIDLKKAAGSWKNHADEDKQMIPIPKDYI